MNLINKDNLKKEEINSYYHKVRAFIFDEDGKLYVTKMKSNSYNLPGGRVDGTEDINDALIREIKEEMGILIDKSNIFHIGNYHFYHKDFPHDEIISNRENEIDLFFIKGSYKYNANNLHLTEYEKSVNFEVIKKARNEIDEFFVDDASNPYKKFTDIELEYLCLELDKFRRNKLC